MPALTVYLENRRKTETRTARTSGSIRIFILNEIPSGGDAKKTGGASRDAPPVRFHIACQLPGAPEGRKVAVTRAPPWGEFSRRSSPPSFFARTELI